MSSISESGTQIDRRSGLKLLVAAMAVPALSQCSPPSEEIIPYARMPEGTVAGEPMRFATTIPLNGFGRGFLGVSVDGRPVKIEGNPKHPFSLGATDVFAEADVLSLYDGERSSHPRQRDHDSTWPDFLESWSRLPRDSRVGLVTGRIVSPTLLARIATLTKRYPALRWYRYEPVNDDAARAGARLVFGHVLTALPDWTKADTVLCLAADPLGAGPANLRVARAYAARRRDKNRQRIYAVESAWTLSGAAADVRLALRTEQIGEVARFLANRLGASLGDDGLPTEARAFADGVTRDLIAAKGRALVLVGESQPPEVHALCHWINERLAAPITYLPSLDPVETDHGAALSELADDLRGGRMDALMVLDANPVYDAPDVMQMADLISAVPLSAYLGMYQDETATASTWRLPLSHALESWGDARAVDGTASFVQPLIRPLYDTRTASEFLALLAGEPLVNAYDLTRSHWQNQVSGDFESWWRTALHDGVIARSASPPLPRPTAKLVDLPRPKAARGLTMVLAPHPSLWDGRFASNAWLQECPAPFTKEVWGNAVQLAPEDALRIGIADGDTVDIIVADQVISSPATIIPEQASGAIAASLGHGRTRAGRIGTKVGVRFCGLGDRPLQVPFVDVGLRKSETTLVYLSTQHHTQLGGRAEDLFQFATPNELARSGQDPPALASLLPSPTRGDYAWGMVVDTDSCIGCNACVVACQAENNVPVVGPEEIAEGRDMHWLRVDAYALTQGAAARRGFQPVPCMHCELAPCEPVCPVAASVHDHEGLNVQVYNRCIGTRFCEANCPYKVRRFNWYDYAGAQAYADKGPDLKPQHNPDVSVRGRGVMEKCNYCLQRISHARRNAEKEGRSIAEGETVTACQAACPTRAIHFGDLNREDSDVSRLRRAPRHYVLLKELNTRPRTTYLKRVYPDPDEPG